jgi:hypothetical protein
MMIWKKKSGRENGAKSDKKQGDRPMDITSKSGTTVEGKKERRGEVAGESIDPMILFC